MQRTLAPPTDVVKPRFLTATNVGGLLGPMAQKPNALTRLEELKGAHGLAEMASKASLSGEAIRGWMKDLERGGPPPGAVYAWLQLAHAYGRTLDWFFEPQADAPHRAADTITAAKEAAAMLTDLDGVPQGEAWSMMRDLRGETVVELYSAARRLLPGAPLRGAHIKDSFVEEAKDLGKSRLAGRSRKTRK